MKRVFILLTAGLMSVSGRAQQSMPPMQSMQPDEMPFFYYEAVNLVGTDSTRSRIDIPYRVDNQFFVTVRNTDASFPHAFVRRGEVYLELLDKDGVSKARKIDRFEIGEVSTENVPTPKRWHEGIASFMVPPGEYSITFEINDLESERKFLDRNRTVVAQQFAGDKLQISNPLFVMPASNSAQTISPLTFGGNILYGAGASLYVQLFSEHLTREPIRVEYSISLREIFQRDSEVFATDTVDRLELLPEGFLTVDAEATSPGYKLSSSYRETAGAFLLPLDAEKWPLRPFTITLKIKQGKLEATLEHRFRMVWPDMPSSLRDVDFALEALRHITSEDELDSLQSGSKETRLKHLEEFWKKKDPTPNTNFNEMMVEYYRRVDHALRTFSSMKAADGYKSDRGRIYILYGPPSKTERTLDPNEGYKEVWTYEKQNKKFLFADRSKSGNYLLVSTQTL